MQIHRIVSMLLCGNLIINEDANKQECSAPLPSSRQVFE